MPDMFGLLEGIGPETKSRSWIICDRFIKKVSQMDGDQLANFASDVCIDLNGYDLVLTFRIPFTTDSINSHLRNTKRDGTSGIRNDTN